MSVNAVVLDSFRKRLAAFMAGKGELTPIAGMAFGDGGHNADLTAKTPSKEATALNHEVLRKPITAIKQVNEFSVTAMGTIERTELVGIQLSEAALLDQNGLLIGIKNFAPKVKEGDEKYEVSVELRF